MHKSSVGKVIRIKKFKARNKTLQDLVGKDYIPSCYLEPKGDMRVILDNVINGKNLKTMLLAILSSQSNE